MKTYNDDITGHVGASSAFLPRINYRHIDGPVLTFTDGQMHWLTWRERWRLFWGWDDARSLQIKHRPNLTRRLEEARRFEEYKARWGERLKQGIAIQEAQGYCASRSIPEAMSLREHKRSTES